MPAPQIPRLQQRCSRWAVALLSVLGLTLAAAQSNSVADARPPNVLLVIADQWRHEAFGYAGNPDVKTPNLDRLARSSVDFVNAVAGLPVCSPTRASLLTGQRPLTHGVFLNDVPLNPAATSLPKVLREAGYHTACIGKWHLNGDGRSEFIPAERRQGFEYWKVLECTHDYNHSAYYADSPEQLHWQGYDAIAQSHDAGQYLRDHQHSTKPFFLMLAWGPPHDPYLTAPEKYRAMYQPEMLTLRPNVPASAGADARKNLAGYYAHCTALDDCLGELLQVLRDTGEASNTIVIFTSDHGDMLGSQAMEKKQKPYDESTRVPLLICLPERFHVSPRPLDSVINSEDIMPTILSLCGIPIPKSVEGLDYAPCLRGGVEPGDGATVISCVAPFGEWPRRRGGREYRGLRSKRYTYVRDLKGPWLLFDDQTDPYQTNNIVNQANFAALQARMDSALRHKLAANGDSFLPADEYIKQWGYHVDTNGTVPYKR